MKKVSIIVPIYNSEKNIKQCIDSIVNQTYNNVEIVLVNDGSKDNSLMICEEYGKKYNNIKVIDKTNNGVSEARNDGIKNSTGDYIVFIDSDDYIDENMVEEIMKYSQYDYVVFGYYIRTSNNDYEVLPENKKYESLESFSNDFCKLYCNNLINSPCNKLFKKDLITSFFPKNMSMGEDLIFNLNYLKNCSSIKCLSFPLYNYIISKSESLSNKYNSNAVENSLLLQKSVLDFCNKNFKQYPIELINNKYLEDCFSNVQKMIFSKKFSRGDCLRQIEQILSYEITHNALKENSIENIQYKLFVLALKRKYRNLIYFCFRLKGKVKGVL